jgi:hypothetical protein
MSLSFPPEDKQNSRRASFILIWILILLISSAGGLCVFVTSSLAATIEPQHLPAASMRVFEQADYSVEPGQAVHFKRLDPRVAVEAAKDIDQLQVTPTHQTQLPPPVTVVPLILTSTPTRQPTFTSTPLPTASPTSTSTPLPPTATSEPPTATPLPTNTPQPETLPTSTPLPTTTLAPTLPPPTSTPVLVPTETPLLHSPTLTEEPGSNSNRPDEPPGQSKDKDKEKDNNGKGKGDDKGKNDKK